MEKKQPNLTEYFQLPNPGLRAYFHRTEIGNQDDYRTPFWNGRPREQILNAWEKEFNKLDIQSKYPGLYDFEMEMKSKVGPLSYQLPLEDRMEDIEQYFTDYPGEMVSDEALSATIKYFSPIKGLRLRSESRTIANMRLSTNSGTPFFTKRKNVVTKLSQARKFKEAAVLGWRGQEGGIDVDDVKQRVIWMMPFLLNIAELQFYQPGVEAVQSKVLVPAYVSMDTVDLYVTKLFETKGQDDYVICTDFTKFDHHFNPIMQSIARAVIDSLLVPQDRDWLETVFPKKFNLPLICSDSLMFEGPHGMGSGSGGTNFDECLSHKALQFEAAISAGAELNKYSLAYGDDGILTYPGITVEHVTDTYVKRGQDMNKLKQMVSKTDAVVLRRWHSTSYREGDIMVGVYSTFRALGRLMGQERFYDPEKWGPKMVILRAWSIIENCNHSPYFEEFVDFVMKGDKYKLGTDIPGFLENVESTAQEAIDMLPDFLGYTKTQMKHVPGIKQWRIYKYLIRKEHK